MSYCVDGDVHVHVHGFVHARVLLHREQRVAVADVHGHPAHRGHVLLHVVMTWHGDDARRQQLVSSSAAAVQPLQVEWDTVQ